MRAQSSYSAPTGKRKAAKPKPKEEESSAEESEEEAPRLCGIYGCTLPDRHPGLHQFPTCDHGPRKRLKSKRLDDAVMVSGVAFDSTVSYTIRADRRGGSERDGSDLFSPSASEYPTAAAAASGKGGKGKLAPSSLVPIFNSGKEPHAAGGDADGGADGDGSLFTVEAILDVRRALRGGKEEYLIKWQGYSAKHNSWEPAANLTALSGLIADFEADRRRRGKEVARERGPAAEGDRSERAPYAEDEAPVDSAGWLCVATLVVPPPAEGRRHVMVPQLAGTCSIPFIDGRADFSNLGLRRHLAIPPGTHIRFSLVRASAATAAAAATPTPPKIYHSLRSAPLIFHKRETAEDYTFASAAASSAASSSHHPYYQAERRADRHDDDRVGAHDEVTAPSAAAGPSRPRKVRGYYTDEEEVVTPHRPARPHRGTADWLNRVRTAVPTDGASSPADGAPTFPAAAPNAFLDLGVDLLLEIFGAITCKVTLQRAVCSCRTLYHTLDGAHAASVWAKAWLTVPLMAPDYDAAGEYRGMRISLTAADALKRAPAGERVRLLPGTVVNEDVMVLQPLTLVGSADCVFKGILNLYGGGGYGGDAAVCGKISGLTLSHFMNEAISVHGGAWELHECATRSSSKRQRATTAINIRNDATLRLIGCELTGCCHAIRLERAASSLRAQNCTFSNTKDAIVTLSGGSVVVEHSQFEVIQSAFKLDERVVGKAVGNTVVGELFGKWLRPSAFKCRGNQHTGSDEEEEADASS